MTETAAPTVTPVEDHAAVIDVLVDLAALAGYVDALTSTYQSGLGFLTHQAKIAQDERTREERHLRDWNAINYLPAPSGDIPTPGNFRAIAVDADVTFTLRHLVRRTLNRLRTRTTLGPIPTLTEDPTVADLLAYLRRLVLLLDPAVDHRGVLELHRELTVLREKATTLVEGNDRVLLDDTCPHCGLRTLVVYFRDAVIRCDEDPHTGRHAPCRCSDPLCECKTKPITYRHQWFRDATDQRKTHPSQTWNHLAGRLKFTRLKQGAPR